MFLRLAATPRSEQTLPREALARRVSHRGPFFRCHLKGLLCGAGVDPPPGRGSPSGAREAQLFLGYTITNIFSKIQNDMTTTTKEHCIMGISHPRH